ncbi:LysM peptidoglycan-binding domain-containing M23 family metallopeptidase [Streptomyces sp. NPDC002779]|uniref:LysM peptidoglycan-binding domain-containing M23 family metallopeptidase n=1 Tax=Streptomyces sp. NPDC002779 TaxID=3364664 RepID=UPI0036ACD114
MPAKGKHRRPKALRFTRSIAVAGTGGAALALPLLGATGAHAAPSQSVPEKAVQSVQTADKKAAEKKATAKKATATTYTVRSGDYLSKIANEQNVSGGWEKLYADNREAVGDDPALIHPGLKLSIGKRAATTDTAEKPAAKSSTKSSSAESSSSSSAKSSEAAESSQAPESEAATTSQAAQSSAGGFSSPVSGAGVGTAYKVAGSMWSSGYHTGVDFVVPTGTSLKAVGAGTVVSAGWAGAYGNQVVIRLADGHYAQYAHLSSLSVSSGQSVTAGQQVGLSGSTGNSTGPHLHFEIRTTPDYGSDVDPVAYLRAKGVSV